MSPGDSDPALLARCLRDVVGLLAIPSMARGRTPSEVADVGLDAIVSVVPVELAYVIDRGASGVVERARLRGVATDPSALSGWAAALAPSSSAADVEGPGTLGKLRVVAYPVRATPGAGLLVLGSRSRGFPSREQAVVLQAAQSLFGSAIDGARLVEEAREADHRKDDFLALLGHELRNPLAPIVTALDLMRRGAPDSVRAREVIERQVQHLRGLVDDLLDVARVSRGKLELERADIDLAGALGHAVEMVSPDIDRRRQRIHVAIEPGAIVRGDARRLAQVIANLLHNASKFTPDGGEITLRATRRDGVVAVAVADTGTGIAPEHLARIWEPFVQVERRLERASGSLGLGLSLVHTIVELHGGRVSAKSAGLGAGSTFEIALPESASAPSPARIEPPAPLERAGGRMVLVVDDNEDAAEMLAIGLELHGYVTRVAHDGARALDAAAREVPDAAVLDIGLPGMDGYELARRLRARHPALRIVALTGFGAESDRARAAGAGFDAFHVKPVDLDALAALLGARDARG